MGLRGLLHNFRNESKMADDGHIEFRKMLISQNYEQIAVLHTVL